MEHGGVDVLYTNELGGLSQRAKALPNQTALLRGGTPHPLGCPMILHVLDCWACDHSREGTQADYPATVSHLYHWCAPYVWSGFTIFKCPCSRRSELLPRGTWSIVTFAECAIFGYPTCSMSPWRYAWRSNVQYG